MKFQIEKLVIWPVQVELPPQEINFHLGKVNIITGASRTGKSAVIPIIDYCLGSGTCSIPIEIIRDNASWYGIVVVLEGEKLLLARKAPVGQRPSTECFVSRGCMVTIPNEIEKSNQNTESLKLLLDSISQVPYHNRDDGESGFDSRLSFRDLTHLLFQSQDIVASQSILFYKTHEFVHHEKLRRWFPFILGVETVEIILAQQRCREVDAELKRLKKQLEKEKSISYDWLERLQGQINTAIGYGLYDGNVSPEMPQTQLLAIAKEVASTTLTAPKTSLETLTRSRKEIERLESEELALSTEIAAVKKRIKDVGNLETNLTIFEASAKRKVERLSIADWLESNKQNASKCPFCGGEEHPSAHEETSKIIDAVKRYENVATRETELPVAFQRDKLQMEQHLNELLEKKNTLHNRFDRLREEDKEAAEYQQRAREMAIFIGQIKSTVEYVERLSGDDGLTQKIQELIRQRDSLHRQLSMTSTASLMKRALAEISQTMLMRLQTLDVEENYKKIPPQFDPGELNIKVMGTDGALHWLAEVGSASNWVSFHLAFFCALQEYLVGLKNQYSPVPSFMVFDQPSQVYFPKIRKMDTNDDVNYETDEDEEAVRKMFQTLADSVRSSNGFWQVIVLDHARAEIYNGIADVVEIAEWRNGKKLIPLNWLPDNTLIE